MDIHPAYPTYRAQKLALDAAYAAAIRPFASQRRSRRYVILVKPAWDAYSADLAALRARFPAYTAEWDLVGPKYGARGIAYQRAFAAASAEAVAP